MPKVTWFTVRMPRRPATSGDLLRLIREEGVTTRSELCRRAGLSRPAVSLRVGRLLAGGLVVEHTSGASTGGRPPARLEFNAAGGAVLVATLGHRSSQLAVCDLAAEILVQAETELPTELGPETALPLLLDQWTELLGKAGLSESAVRGVGVGIPGPVEYAAARAGSPSALPGWGDTELRPAVAERFPVPAYLDNDVNVAALGEHRAGLGELGDDLLYVKFSRGLGAAVIAGGRIQRGTLGAAGQIGHIAVRDAGDLSCRCGNTGCVETVAGGAALLRRLGRAADLAQLTRLAEAGDAEVVALIRDAGRRAGEVIAGAVNLLNPAVVILGGDLARAYEPLIAGVREVVYQRATALATRQLRIEPTRLGDTAGLTGCAAMVLDHILAPDAVDTLLTT